MKIKKTLILGVLLSTMVSNISAATSSQQPQEDSISNTKKEVELAVRSFTSSLKKHQNLFFSLYLIDGTKFAIFEHNKVSHLEYRALQLDQRSTCWDSFLTTILRSKQSLLEDAINLMETIPNTLDQVATEQRAKFERSDLVDALCVLFQTLNGTLRQIVGDD